MDTFRFQLSIAVRSFSPRYELVVEELDPDFEGISIDLLLPVSETEFPTALEPKGDREAGEMTGYVV